MCGSSAIITSKIYCVGRTSVELLIKMFTVGGRGAFLTDGILSEYLNIPSGYEYSAVGSVRCHNTDFIQFPAVLSFFYLFKRLPVECILDSSRRSEQLILLGLSRKIMRDEERTIFLSYATRRKRTESMTPPRRRASAGV
jgi:hypothetical protein